ncbi:Uncharacterized protein APZ42_025877 [Daphnia magna]|uniref:Uncharacterized protein n=1 Tax=Daphnia magna TaxID=35525 RepID=A0A164SPN6_9CRUS|nr:Uncharacterized protein APZ42_025877 [Daphnia magna]
MDSTMLFYCSLRGIVLKFWQSKSNCHDSVFKYWLVKLKLQRILTCNRLAISTELVKWHEFCLGISSLTKSAKYAGSEGKSFLAHSPSRLVSVLFISTLTGNKHRCEPQDYYSLECQPYVIQKIAGLKIFPVIGQRA